jgi:hypothetical protein
MEAATIRNAMIVQMQGDTSLTAEFTTASISYGLGKQIKATDLVPRSIRVVQLGRGEEVEAEWGGGKAWVRVPYRFHVVILFMIDDTQTEKDAEDNSSKYDRLIRKAISKDSTIGGVVESSQIGRTFFLTHPEKDNAKIVLIEVTAISHEQSDVR